MKKYDEKIDRLYVLSLMMASTTEDSGNAHEILQEQFEQVDAELIELYAELNGDEFEEILQRIDEISAK